MDTKGKVCYQNRSRDSSGDSDGLQAGWTVSVTGVHTASGTLPASYEMGNKGKTKHGVFWDVTPCGSCKNRLHHQGDKIR
jgi:hypothetical protein